MKVVYRIQNLRTGHFYIGSSSDFTYRKWVHLKELREGRHHNPILQNSWNKYGEDVFLFAIVEVVEDKEKLVEREQYYIDSMNPRYNICRIAGSPLGVKHTNEARLHMSLAHRGKKLTPESITKRSLKQGGENHYLYGKKRSEEDRIKIKEGLALYRNKEGYIPPRKGQSPTNEQRRRIAEKLMKPITQYDLSGNFIMDWKGSTDAGRALGINPTNINQCCNGKLKTSGNFIWKFKINL